MRHMLLFISYGTADMNMEYVKNVIVRFMRFAAEMEQEQMVQTLLALNTTHNM